VEVAALMAFNFGASASYTTVTAALSSLYRAVTAVLA